MTRYEYKAVSAPIRGEKTRGLKSAEDRLAAAFERLLNRMADDGWEFVRTESLPAEEKTTFGRATSVNAHIVVFRRPAAEPAQGTKAPLVLEEGRKIGPAPRIGEAPAAPAPRLGPAGKRESDL